jgi:hypothetical protein
MKRSVSVSEQLESYAATKMRKEQADADLAQANIDLNQRARKLAIDAVKAAAKLAKPEYAEYIDSMRELVFHSAYRSELSAFVVQDLAVSYNLSGMSYSVEFDGQKYGIGWRGTKFGNLRTKRAKEVLGPLGPFIAWMRDTRLSAQFSEELHAADKDAVSYCSRANAK